MLLIKFTPDHKWDEQCAGGSTLFPHVPPLTIPSSTQIYQFIKTTVVPVWGQCWHLFILVHSGAQLTLCSKITGSSLRYHFHWLKTFYFNIRVFLIHNSMCLKPYPKAWGIMTPDWLEKLRWSIKIQTSCQLLFGTLTEWASAMSYQNIHHSRCFNRDNSIL